MRSCAGQDGMRNEKGASPIMALRDPDQARRFQEMVTAQSRSLYRFALHLARDSAAAEDLVQETFVNAWRGFHTFRPGSNARAWLFRILRNAYVERHRRAKRHEPQTVDIEDIDEWYLYARVRDAEFEQETSNPEAAFFSKLTDDEVTSALAALGPRFREVFALADLEGLSYREIGEIVGIPQGTVMSRLYRARHQLQRALWEYCVRTQRCRVPAAASPHPPMPWKCHGACRQIYGYLDKTLDEPALAAIDHHLRHCRVCCDRFEFQRRLTAVVRKSLGAAEMPGELQARLHAIVDRF